MIRLSIIIPHYNSADLLDKLLSTIPNVQEVQVIVVDDFSTQGLDELEECKQRYINTNVEFYTNECKKSAGGARNTGLSYAKGQWLLFADADDYFLQDFYESAIICTTVCGSQTSECQVIVDLFSLAWC